MSKNRRPGLCRAEAHGYTCDRPAEPAHDIHHDQDYGDLWITFPEGADQLAGREQWTGYRLLVAETELHITAQMVFWNRPFGPDEQDVPTAIREIARRQRAAEVERINGTEPTRTRDEGGTDGVRTR